MKKFFGEFKTFITRGNVVDMAVGIIIGGAFTGIVNGVCNYVLKPVINLIISLILGEDALTGLFIYLKKAWLMTSSGEYYMENGKYVVDNINSIYIDCGALIQLIINFILTALVLFIIVKVINNLRDESRRKLTKEEKAELKANGIKRSDKKAVKAYFEAKAQAEAEAKAKAEAEAAEAARLERLANPTTEDLLKQILAEMKKA